MSLITPEDEALMAAVKADPVASELLTHKCRWEGMGRYAVLKEWGDPRTWDSYKSPIAAARSEETKA